MHHVATVDIDRPADEVFAYLADFENNPAWQGGMDHCEWTSEPPIAVGSTYAQLAHFLGREIRTTFEVTAYEPGERVRIESIVSTFPIQVTRSVEALDEGRCRVRAEVTGQPPWYLRWMPGMTGMVRRSIDNDYANLKRLLETA